MTAATATISSPNCPPAKFRLSRGPRMSAPVGFTVKLTGRGGHGSRPDLCINPLDAFCDIYASCKELLAVKINPFSPVTFVVGTISYGTVGNIIPDTLTFAGSFRLADFSKSGEAAVGGFKKILANCCAKHDVKYELTLNAYDMAVINNPDCSAIAEKAITKALGPEYIGTHEPWMASEGYGMYLKYWPGILRLCRNSKRGVRLGRTPSQYQFRCGRGGTANRCMRHTAVHPRFSRK